MFWFSDAENHFIAFTNFKVEYEKFIAVNREIKIKMNEPKDTNSLADEIKNKINLKEVKIKKHGF